MTAAAHKCLITGEALSEPRMVSGKVLGEALNVSQKIIIGHCALMGRAVNNWYLYVMCRPHTKSDAAWQSVTTTFPSAEVKVVHNDVEVTLPPLEEAYEMAVFGRPGKKDMKRMQLALYGSTPKAGTNWTIQVELYDDISTVTQQVRAKHFKLGNKLLTARAGLFVANSDDHIKIELSGLDAAFQIKGSAIKEISSKEAWNPPEDALDCPTLVYEIARVDESKSTFFGKISASHVGDHAEADIMADFEKDADRMEMETSRKDYEDYRVTIKALDTTSRKTKKENSAVSQNCIKIPGKLGVKIPRVFFTLAVILMVSVSQCNASDDNHQPELGFMQTKDVDGNLTFRTAACTLCPTAGQKEDKERVFQTSKEEKHAEKIEEIGWHSIILIVAMFTCSTMAVVFPFLGELFFTGVSKGKTMELSNERHLEKVIKRLSHETSRFKDVSTDKTMELSNGRHLEKEIESFPHETSRFKASYLLLLMTCVFGNPSYEGRPEGIISTVKESGEKHIESIRLTAETVRESGEKLNADQTKTETMVLSGQQLSYDEIEGDLKHMTGSTNVNVFVFTPLDRMSESTHACSIKGVHVEFKVYLAKHGRSGNRKKRVSYVVRYRRASFTSTSYVDVFSYIRLDKLSSIMFYRNLLCPYQLKTG